MDTNGKFLPHLSDPLRRTIAFQYAQHEMRKLFPGLRDAALWRSMDEQIERWHEELSMENFWNGIHGISMGFHLKSLVPWITSLHMQWAEKDVALGELWFGGKFGPIGQLGVRESASEVEKSIFLPEHKELLDQTKKILSEKSSETAPRDTFPIFAVRKEGELRVIDGNRRLLQALVNGKETIRAFVGEPVAEPALYEQWVPTSLLVDTVFWCKRQIQDGRDTVDATAHVIAELIRNSSAGRHEFTHRTIRHDEKIHVQLLETVKGILNRDGVVI